MNNNHKLEKKIIASISSQRPEEAVGRAINTWQSIAKDLIPIIGENGFSILYARTIYLNQHVFPWLTDDQATQQENFQFITLKVILEGRRHNEIVEVSKALLITFTDILATLIGEPLTTGILRSAWNEANPAEISQEHHHE